MNCSNCQSPLDEEAAFCPHCGQALLDGPVYDNYAYAAFISYRHRTPDADVARKLHKALEAYRVPSRVEIPPVANARSRHLGRVFRDEEELAASDSLPDNIRAALKRSRAIVVVCSPHTPESAWVNQEVLLFMSFHGRKNVMLALAEGEPAESVPQLLRERIVVNEDGSASLQPMEPLAADFRPSASGKFKQETLRIVAGMLSCPFDDLRRRNREQRRKRAFSLVAAGAAVAVTCGLLVGHFARQTEESRHAAQVEESHTLAAQSRAQFAQGDRTGAIETALSALPSRKEPNRPVVDEAVDALADALEVYPDASSYWRPSYVIDMPAAVAETQYSPNEGWFAVLDADFNLRVFDIVTGKQQASCKLPAQLPEAAEGDASHVHVTPVAGGIVAWCDQGESSCLVCFDAQTGKQRWFHDDTPNFHGVDAAGNGSILAVFTVTEGLTLNVAAFDIETGNLLKVQIIEDSGFAPYPTPTACTFGDTATDFWLASGNLVQYVSLDTGKAVQAQLPCEHATSVAPIPGGVAVASRTMGNDEGKWPTVSYAVSAYRLNGNAHEEQGEIALSQVWTVQDDYAIDNVGTGTSIVAVDGVPEIRGWKHIDWSNAPDANIIVYTAGATTCVASCESGDTVFTQTAAESVVGVGGLRQYGIDSLLYLALANGDICVKDPNNTLNGSLGNTLDFTFPDRLAEARIFCMADEYLVAIGQSQDQENRMIAYHTDLTSLSPDYAKEIDNEKAFLPDPDKSNYTTEELIEMGREVVGN